MLCHPVEAEAFYLSNRALVERTAMQVCRRNHASAADTEDFLSEVHLHLIADGYAVMRAFEGRGDVGAYLYAVIRRLFQDWRNAHWGRWRPSAGVKRQGSVAILLETLLVRDKLSMDEAIEVMRTNHGVSEPPAALRAMADAFPPRHMRTFTSEAALESMADDTAAANQFDATDAADRVGRVLDEALAALECQDRLILRMRFEDDLPVSSISRVVGVDQHQLYRRVHRLLRDVRQAMLAGGISEAEAREAITARGFAWREEGPS